MAWKDVNNLIPVFEIFLETVHNFIGFSLARVAYSKLKYKKGMRKVLFL